jgi:hypothetical protein
LSVGIPTAETADRLQVSLALVLTLVAFKFVIMSNVPKVSYLTYLDKYNLLAFGFLFVGAFAHVLVATEGSTRLLPLEKDSKEIEAVDLLIQFLLLGIWAVLNGGFFVAYCLDAFSDTWMDVWKTNTDKGIVLNRAKPESQVKQTIYVYGSSHPDASAPLKERLKFLPLCYRKHDRTPLLAPLL